MRLTATGQHAEYARAPISGQSLGNGWYLVFGRGCNHRIASEGVLTALSADCDVVAGRIEEHVMFSSSERWQTGVRLWRVEHDNQKGARHLDKSGTLPEYFEEVVAQYSDEQDREDAAKKEVDFYFEIPLLCAKRIVGFKHDESSADLADDGYEVFTPLAGDKRWWQWWK